MFLGAGTADLLRNESFYQTWITAGLHRTRPSDVWNHFPSTSVDVIAERFGLEGPRGCVVAACSSSTIAIGRAADAVRDGRAAAVLAGGTDALARLTFSGFNQLKLMDPAPCRPFDKSRAGMSIGEGAGILVLENLERAVRRGATIYAELAGYGLGCEAFRPTAPEPEGRPGLEVAAPQCGADLGLLAIAYMLMPIGLIIVFSFDDPRASSTSPGRASRWSTGNAFGIAELTDALLLSLRLALFATVISTVLGTLVALAMVRYDFFGRRASNYLIPTATG